MKHLISKEHHPHLKKRAILEIVGLTALVWLSYDQRDLISTAITAIRDSDVLFLLLMFSVYWILLPLTPISYRLLSGRKLSLRNTALAQLAAAGPGRVIPGGLGHISIAAVHLSKRGIALRKAVIITVSNNVIGMVVNSAIVISAIAVHPTLVDRVTDQVSFRNIAVVGTILLIIFAVFQWLSHIRATRKTVRSVNKEWHTVIGHVLHNPHKLFTVVLIAATISVGHMTMLLLAGEALSVNIAVSDAFIALGAGVLLGGAVPTPGGLGAVEAGTTSALITLGYDPTDAVSVALLFRTATYWQPLIPGVVSYLYLREKKLL